MQGKNLNKDERKEKYMERRKNFYAACTVFLLILVIFLGKEVFGENKYNAMENYLSNHYYSKEHIIRAMKTRKERIAKFDHLVFLCNENTASASEVMMFNMKSDFGDKITIVGNKTYGKNFCYSYKRFQDGDVFMFLSGMMGNSKGDTFDDDGILPDYQVRDEQCIEKAKDLLRKGW